MYSSTFCLFSPSTEAELSPASSYVTEHGGGPNDATGNEAGALLVANIKDTRSMLSDLNLDIEVGNSDAGSYFNNLVLEAVDYGVCCVHQALLAD